MNKFAKIMFYTFLIIISANSSDFLDGFLNGSIDLKYIIILIFLVPIPLFLNVLLTVTDKYMNEILNVGSYLLIYLSHIRTNLPLSYYTT